MTTDPCVAACAGRHRARAPTTTGSIHVPASFAASLSNDTSFTASIVRFSSLIGSMVVACWQAFDHRRSSSSRQQQKSGTSGVGGLDKRRTNGEAAAAGDNGYDIAKMGRTGAVQARSRRLTLSCSLVILTLGRMAGPANTRESLPVDLWNSGWAGLQG